MASSLQGMISLSSIDMSHFLSALGGEKQTFPWHNLGQQHGQSMTAMFLVKQTAQ